MNIESIQGDKVIETEIVTSLIKLLNPNNLKKPEFYFGNSIQAWDLIMKATLKADLKDMIEGEIFENFISSFLFANEEIQQIMYPQITSMTVTMMNDQVYQKEFSNIIVRVIFKIMDMVHEISVFT